MTQSDALITDDDILIAMTAHDDPERVARRVVELFAQRVGRRMTEAEISESARVILKTLKLPIGTMDL
jgi:hypothetical protein